MFAGERPYVLEDQLQNNSLLSSRSRNLKPLLQPLGQLDYCRDHDSDSPRDPPEKVHRTFELLGFIK